MNELKELNEQLSDVTRALNEITDLVERSELQTFDDEQDKRFNELSGQRETLVKRIESHKKLEQAKAWKTTKNEGSSYSPVSRSISADEENLALRGWLLSRAGQAGKIDSRMYRAAERVGLNFGNSEYVFRAQTVGAATEGGYLTNGSLFQGVEKTLKAYGGVRGVAKVISTSTGETLHWATNNDTGNVGAIVGENTEVTNTSTVFGTVPLVAYKYSSMVQPVSLELIQDSGIDIGAYLGELLGERIGRISATHFTTGDGSSKPHGVVAGSTLGKTCTDDVTFTFPELIDLYHSVDIAYRDNAVWMMNDATVAYIRKMVDTPGRPLFLEDYVGGMGLTLLGKRIIVNNDMATIAASAKPILFGDFSKYIVRDVAGIRLQVLNERYAENGSVGFIAFARMGGRLINTGAVKHMVMAGS